MRWWRVLISTTVAKRFSRSHIRETTVEHRAFVLAVCKFTNFMLAMHEQSLISNRGDAFKAGINNGQFVKDNGKITLKLRGTASGPVTLCREVTEVMQVVIVAVSNVSALRRSRKSRHDSRRATVVLGEAGSEVGEILVVLRPGVRAIVEGVGDVLHVVEAQPSDCPVSHPGVLMIALELLQTAGASLVVAGSLVVVEVDIDSRVPGGRPSDLGAPADDGRQPNVH